MAKSATDVMQEIVFSAVIDSIDALKRASKGMPNTLLRDVNALHANSTFADLPKELQATITASVRAAFNRLLKEGYSVSQGQPEPARPAVSRRPTEPRGRPPSGDSRPPRGGRPPAGDARPPRGGRPPSGDARPPRGGRAPRKPGPGR
jgi:hypothetical protein